MAAALLITGTDTGVGKTFVGCGLAGALVRAGFRVAPFKPAETGCLYDPASNQLIPADARMLESAASTRAHLDVICPYRFALPVAPWVAAEREGQRIDPAVLARCFQELVAAHDWLLVESAGGILTPLTAEFHFGDLAKLLNLPVLVVAGSRLGVLNQTLLTIAYLKHAGVPVLGCVLNHPFGEERASKLGEEHLPALATNLGALRKLAQVPIMSIPFAAKLNQSELERLFDQLAAEMMERVPRRKPQT